MFSAHTYNGFCETVIYIIQQPHQLDATTEQNADLDPELLELKTTSHVVYARTKQTLASIIVTKALAWVRQ